MSLLLHAMEACGLLLAASSVRMVAGRAAGLTALAGMIVARLSGSSPAPFLLPAALAVFLLLKMNSTRLQIAFSAVATLLLFASITAWHQPLRGSLRMEEFVFAIPPAIWLVLAIAEKSAPAVAMTAPPLATLLADRSSAIPLLIASSIALTGLMVRSYRLKRQTEGGW